jgi:hypothetical protein
LNSKRPVGLCSKGSDAVVYPELLFTWLNPTGRASCALQCIKGKLKTSKVFKTFEVSAFKISLIITEPLQ